MKHLLVIFATILFCFGSITQGYATSVDVYFEGGYTDSTFIVKIFADILPDEQGALVSAGFTFIYPTVKLTVSSNFKKNDNTWYLGSPNEKIAYLQPKLLQAGKIQFLLGKIARMNPLEGVQGKRILLGSIIFDRIDGSELPTFGDFQLFADTNDGFADFVTINGNVLDDSFQFTPALIASLDSLRMRDTIRALQIINNQPADMPVRASEFESSSDSKVGLDEASELQRH